jgi:DNA-binding beta-propeller fold protein YncE
MRVNGPVYLSACFLAALSAPAFAPPKVSSSARITAGVKTPGVQIPMASLKAEAEIVLESPAESVFVTGETAYVATKSQLLPLNLKTNKVDAAIGALKTPCSNLTTAFRSTWVPNCAESKIDRWDARGLKVAASVAVPVSAHRQSVAASADSLWVLSDEKTTLSRIDPDTNKVVAEIRLPAACNSILFADNALWVTCPKDSKVFRIDPNTNVVVNRIDVPGQPISLAFGEATVWVFCKTDGKVVRIDPKTNKTGAMVELKTPGLEGEIAFGEGFVWASSPGFPMMRIDPATDKVAQQFVGDGGGELYFGGGSVWAFNLKANTLSRFDPKRIKATLAE